MIKDPQKKLFPSPVDDLENLVSEFLPIREKINKAQETKREIEKQIIEKMRGASLKTFKHRGVRVVLQHKDARDTIQVKEDVEVKG